MIAICDDNFHDAEVLADMIRNISETNEIQGGIHIYENTVDLLKELEKGHVFHLIFMDIYLGAERGDHFAEKIVEKYKDVEIVFETESTDFAVKAFELDALHYLVKPVTEEQIREVFHRFTGKYKKKNQMLKIKSGWDEYIFHPERITKVVSEKKGVRVYEKTGESTWVNQAFARIEELLDPGKFLQISRGYLVNMEQIRSMDGKICRLIDGTELLISRKRRAEIRERYHEYLFSKS